MLSENPRTHRPFSNFAEVVESVELPLREVNRISAAGTPAPSPVALASGAGVVVSLPSEIALYTHNLSSRVWKIPTNGWASVVRASDTLFCGTYDDGNILEVNILDGTVVRRIPCFAPVGVMCVLEEILVVGTGQRLIAGLTPLGDLLWSHSWLCHHVAWDGGFLVALRSLRDELVALEPQSGRTVWTFRAEPEEGGHPQDQSQSIVDYAVDSERVIVVTRNGRVMVLDAWSGRVTASGRTAVQGLPLVMRDVIFFKRPGCLSKFDLSIMQEAKRFEYDSAVLPLYGEHRPTVNAFCVTGTSVIWTTNHSALMAIDFTRAPYRVTINHLPGALMPLYVPPFGHGGFTYYETKGASSSLVCFSSER
jgi:outer membrane protein assembly factor BamB